MTFPHTFPTASDLSDAAAFPVKFPRHAVDLPDAAAFPAKLRVASGGSLANGLQLGGVDLELGGDNLTLGA